MLYAIRILCIYIWCGYFMVVKWYLKICASCSWEQDLYIFQSVQIYRLHRSKYGQVEQEWLLALSFPFSGQRVVELNQFTARETTLFLIFQWLQKVRDLGYLQRGASNIFGSAGFEESQLLRAARSNKINTKEDTRYLTCVVFYKEKCITSIGKVEKRKEKRKTSYVFVQVDKKEPMRITNTCMYLGKIENIMAK